MDMHAKDIENSNDVNTNDASDQAVLSKGLREIVDAARERQRLEASDAASLPFQTMINRDDSTSGDLCGDWQHFLDQRAARQTELIEHGGRNFRNWIKQREENPPRRNTNIFTWSRIVSSGGKEIFMRTRVEKRRHDNVFNEYTPAQCRYNALENEWDLFEEFALEVKSKNGQDYAGYEHSDSEDDGFDPFEGYEHLYVLIHEFISCLIDSSSGLPAPSDDLNTTSDQPLATSFALDTVERISEDLYVFKLPPSPSCKWVIGVDRPTTVLYICRLVASTPNTHMVLTIAYHLLEHHIPFRTLLLQASSEPEQLNLPYADNANRFNKHQFTTADFNSAMLECRALLGRPQGQAAILRGGIVGRIAREFGSKESGLQGPSIEVTVHHLGYFVPSKHDGYFYWDDDLTGEEIACLCGTYCLYTGRGEQTTTVSWFPPPDVWDKQGYGWPGWTETNEEFFQQWIADIRKGNAKPLSRQNWWRKVHSIKNTRSMLKNNRERAKAYVELNIHAM
ncbi:unnamed protein product [Cyclocybe aegerita]|uniref:Uncharacterized protein n=1 Tax=Cyclocybe aegerita TaxID=1973307 RepID=A0A8S0XNG4_CYCAE|nr:unnamed protein product [Cyclocybe aegerita]